MNITFIKKIKPDGQPCRKCTEIEERLKKDKLWHKIDTIIIADERDPNSEGMLIAKQHQVETAPFFLVETDQQSIKIYTIYFHFVKEVLNKDSNPADIGKDLLDSNPDLDFI